MSLTEQLRRNAALCRTWARARHNDVKPSQMLAMADWYDRLIVQIEGMGKQEAAAKGALSR
jgi:hypothetical protein